MPADNNIQIPGAVSVEPPALEEPTAPREPLPPKPDQQGPEAVSPTGSPTGGPATQPLPTREISVVGDSITLA